VYKVVQTSRVYKQIVQQIEASILGGTLKPGDQLPGERELAQQFAVSRTAVRDAFRALQERGLVDSVAGRGTFVTDGVSQAVRESLDRITRVGHAEGSKQLAELRAMLEPEIAALAALRSEEPHIIGMREAIAAMDELPLNPEAYIEADLDFHLALAEAVGNPIILSLLDSIVASLREQRMQVVRVEGSPQRGQVHHKCILAAIEQHDAAAAREAMRLHLRQVCVDLATLPVRSGSELQASD
jgi:GntR family transcriptional repressor for pyruvate dehydrogenase complex